MVLSITKLIKLLISKGFYPKSFFRIYKVCAFIEIVSNKNGESYMIYIPSKYSFQINNEIFPNIYDLDTVNNKINDEDEDEDDEKYKLIQRYAEHTKDIDDIYHNINIANPGLFRDKKDLEDILKKKYKKNIKIGKNDTGNLKCLKRQMERLRYCVQNIDYRLVIIYKSYLCFLHTEDDIDLFNIKLFPEISERVLYVTLDLELLYNSNDNLNSDLKQISNGINKILDKNYKFHIQNLQTLLTTKENIVKLVNIAISKKQDNNLYIDEFVKLFRVMNDNELQIKNQIQDLKQEKQSSIYSDIEFSHTKHRFDKELSKCQKVKNEVLTQITQLKSENSNISLTMDKILFDNIILLDQVFKNLEILDKF